MLVYYGVALAAPMLLFPVFVALQLLFTIGVALILATRDRVSPRRAPPGRDRPHDALLDDAHRLRAEGTCRNGLRLLILLSPMSPYVAAYQQIFYYRQWPDAGVWITTIGYAVARWRWACGSSSATKTASRSGYDVPGSSHPMRLRAVTPSRVPEPVEAVLPAAQPRRRAQAQGAGAVRRVAPSARRGVLGAQVRLAQGPRRRGAGPRRPQRLGQEHAPQGHRRHPPADERAICSSPAGRASAA